MPRRLGLQGLGIRAAHGRGGGANLTPGSLTAAGAYVTEIKQIVEGGADHIAFGDKAYIPAKSKWLVVYRKASSHSSTDGDCMGQFVNLDFSLSGSEFTIKAGGLLDAREPMISVMPDGTILVALSLRNPGPSPPVGTVEYPRIYNSTDGGDTWGVGLVVNSTNEADLRISSRVVEYDGAWWVGCYDSHAAEGLAYILQSTDQGANWTDHVVYDPVGTNVSECVIWVEGSTMVAHVRDDDNDQFHRLTSTAPDTTWTYDQSYDLGTGTIRSRPSWIPESGGGFLAYMRTDNTVAPYQSSLIVADNALSMGNRQVLFTDRYAVYSGGGWLNGDLVAVVFDENIPPSGGVEANAHMIKVAESPVLALGDLRGAQQVFSGADYSGTAVDVATGTDGVSTGSLTPVADLVTYDGVVYTTFGAAGGFDFLHNPPANGGWFVGIKGTMETTGVKGILGTQAGTSAETGIAIYSNGTTLTVLIGRGVGAEEIILATAPGFFDGTEFSFGVLLEEATERLWIFKNNRTWTTPALTRTSYDTGISEDPLTLAALGGGAFPSAITLRKCVIAKIENVAGDVSAPRDIAAKGMAFLGAP